MNIRQKVDLMEKFTQKYRQTRGMSKSLREIECMKVMFPQSFVAPFEHDLFVGRFIVLPIGHGLEWAHLGGGDEQQSGLEELTKVNGSSSPEVNSAGPSYYGLISQLSNLKDKTIDQALLSRINELILFWEKNDTHLNMVRSFAKKYPAHLYDSDINNFSPPILALTRLSGIELDYEPLLKKGIPGLKNQLQTTAGQTDNEFLLAGLKAMQLLEDSIDYYIHLLEEKKSQSPPERQASRIDLMLKSLNELLVAPPRSFHSALQLIFLYSQLAGVVNYGRLDDFLGDYLACDLENGLIDEKTAATYIESLWHLINAVCNRGNGRVIIGGAGRKNSAAANVFSKLAIQATINTRLIKPQLTLRMHDSVPESIYELALDAIQKGCTFPMLYNDALNVPAVQKAMQVPAADALQYVPYGCGEYMIQGRSTGSPNVCVNFSKAFQLALNLGIDAFDNHYRGGDYPFVAVNTLESYEALENYYFDYLDYILMATIHYQHDSYRFLAQRSAFVFASLLMNDCLARKKPILRGGIRYYSAVNEFYGFTNAIDSLAAVKKVVFDDKQYSLSEVITAVNHDFKDHKDIQEALLQAPKFGNDNDAVDEIAERLHEHACCYLLNHAHIVGLHSFLAVNINNNTNTRWGMKTGAGYDGRSRGEHLAPGNNPHSGRDQNGITAMLNSISRLRADIHAGYVQNLKCSPRLFQEEREKMKLLFKTYFKRKGGTQLMISVVDQKTLIDARAHPEKYPHLLVRCGGFSAKFIDLDENTQIEIINRTCHD